MPAKAVKKNAQVSALMLELSKYMAKAASRRLPPAVAERAKLSLIDTFAAIISGSRLLPGRQIIRFVRPLGGTAEAGIIGTRIVTTTLNAALANGMCAHADESDDTHPPTRTHPGSSVIPAALAIAEKSRLSGELMLRAVVLGYDICARTMLAAKAMLLMRAGHWVGPKGGLFGSAAAAGALLQLDALQMRYMLSYCAQQASGLFTHLREAHHCEKACEMSGLPSHNGVLAALMAADGFTGVEDVFTGDPNFLSTFSPDPEPAALVRDLGRVYEIMNGGIKRWPVGAPVQGPLHVLHELIQRHNLKAADVERLVARIPDKEFWVVNNRDMADVSLQHLLAVMLLDGTLTFAAAHDPARMKDPQLRRLRRRIEGVGDPTLTDPLRRWRCAMEITLKDGRKLTHQTMAAKGTAENPLTRPEVEEKALDLMAPVLGAKRSRILISALYNIENVKNVRTLRKLYSAP